MMAECSQEAPLMCLHSLYVIVAEASGAIFDVLLICQFEGCLKLHLCE